MKIVSIILFVTAFVIIISPPLFSENLEFQRGVFSDNLTVPQPTSFLQYTKQQIAMQEQTESTDAEKQNAEKQMTARLENREKFQACITACSDCIVECKSCANECLNERDSKMMVRCIRLNQDCAAICAVAMESMASGSEFTKRICSLCADVCYACAIECERHIQMDHCTQCAEACRKCAIECIKMSKL
ncbi:MAG: four-helix bundle copper-binding protein [Candidatus Kapaibacteriota bacterium]